MPLLLGPDGRRRLWLRVAFDRTRAVVEEQLHERQLL
jgi:hypothetical protein